MMPPDGQWRVRSRTIPYAKGAIEPEHTHDEHQLVYASRGLLCVDTDRSRWVVPPLRAVWVPARIPHTIVAKADSTMLALYLDSNVTGKDLDVVTVLAVSPLLRELIAHFGDAGDDPARVHYELALIDQLRSAPTVALQLPRISNPLLRQVADALETDPRDDRTLAEFGRDIGAHERTLQRLFAAETGTTFGRWRTQLRLQHGVIALGQGHNVTSAAALSGYHEPSAFIASFRAAFGVTPGRYFDP